MQHLIDGYIFDSYRLLLYKATTRNEIIRSANCLVDCKNKTESIIHTLMKKDYRIMSADVMAIDIAGICLTNNCNLRCNYCSFSSSDKDTNQLTLDDIKLYIKEIIKNRIIRRFIEKESKPLTVGFTGGGEPTYEWELLTKAVILIQNLCNDNKIPLRLILTTNGMLSDKQLEFLSDNFNSIMISYDGLPELQNQNRVGAHKRDTNSTVEHSIYHLSSTNINLTIRSTVWPENYPQIIDMFEHVCSIMPTMRNFVWSVNPTTVEGRAEQNTKRYQHVENVDFLHYYLELVDYIIFKRGKNAISMVDTPLFSNNQCELYCGAFRGNHPWLLPDKSIVTCIESMEFVTRIGKIADGKIEYLKQYSDILLKKMQDKYKVCNTCIAYHFCKGGCPIWHLRSETKMSSPPECSAQVKYYTHILHSLITGGYSFGWSLNKLQMPENAEDEIFTISRADGQQSMQ